MGIEGTLPYENFTFLYPPRPESAILPSLIPSYEDRGWVGNYKLNGTCSLIGVGPDGAIHNLTRHNTKHKMWKPSDRTKVLARSCPRDFWTLFVAELLNDKTPNIKDTLYIFDILVWESKQLIGTTYQERTTFLQNLLIPAKPRQGRAHPWWAKRSHTVIAPGIWLANVITSGLSETFEWIKESEDRAIEGIVLKNPAGKLGMMFKEHTNTTWQVKSRIALPHSHIGF